MASAVNAELIPASPCRSIRLPCQERTEMHFLTPDELDRLAAEMGDFSTLVYFAGSTGLRWGEAVGLKLGRVHMLGGEIEVAEQLAEVGGKLSFKTPKTSQSRRFVSLPPFLIKLLARHLEARPQDPDALVFVGRDGAPLRRSTSTVVTGSPP
jgi:integrase